MWRETPSIAVVDGPEEDRRRDQGDDPAHRVGDPRRWKEETTPSTGASTNSVPSAVWGPSGPATTGTAISAIAAMPA